MRMKELHNSKLTERAKELRRNATKQENHLWYDFLAKYPIRFRRQVTMQNYIVDFFCAKANLIIEVDGSQHFTPEGIAYDAERTAVLQALGYEVLRFSNEDVCACRYACDYCCDFALQRFSFLIFLPWGNYTIFSLNVV